MGEFEGLEEAFDEGDHAGVPCAAFGVVCAADDDLFDFIELMNAVEACGVFAGGAGFSAEAC